MPRRKRRSKTPAKDSKPSLMWRRKGKLSTFDNDTRFESFASLADELDEEVNTDIFHKKVAMKTQQLLIGHQEAETEVFVDLIMTQEGGVNPALMYVVSKLKLESKVSILVNNLIHRGANVSARDKDNRTPLHFAVERNLKGVATKLLENDALPHARDNKGTLPLQIAMDKKNDDMCALLLAYMPNFFVRDLFSSHGANPAAFSFHELIQTDLRKTILSVLDCMVQPTLCAEKVLVYYNVLEADERGRPPNDAQFNPNCKSPLQVIAKQGIKNIVYHDVIRLLVRRKWKEFARWRFQLHGFIFLLSMFCLTFSAIVAVPMDDPTSYPTPLHKARVVMEVLSMIMVVCEAAKEINQFRRHRLEYFMDPLNWMDSSSAILLICVVPLRFTHQQAQWLVFAFGYLFWTIRVFKFAAVFRQTGAYSQTLYRVLQQDFPQFTALFLLVLLTFSVTFYLALRGENDLKTHEETSTIFGILLVGVRILTEAGSVVEYSGDEGYSTISTMLMVCFMFTCVVVLLNILIAQLSDTYQNVQQDAQRGLEVNRAWIVARMELNTIFGGAPLRKKYYVEHEEVYNIERVLSKWESPPLNEMNRYIQDIWQSLDQQKMDFLTIQHRMARQENILHQLQSHLKARTYVERVSQRPASQNSMFFHRSDSEIENRQDEDTVDNAVEAIAKLFADIEEETSTTSQKDLQLSDMNIGSETKENGGHETTL